MSAPTPALSTRLPTARPGTEAAEPIDTAEGHGRHAGSGFEVHLDNFEGPFDVLLGLIAKHKLDVT